MLNATRSLLRPYWTGTDQQPKRDGELESLTANRDHGDKAEEIIGRDSMIEQILDELRTRRSDCLWIHANAGLGKTAIMKRLEYLAARQAGWYPVFYRFNRPLNNRDLGQCLLSLAYQISRLWNLRIPDAYREHVDSPQERIAFLRAQLTMMLSEASSRLQSDETLLILVDALDEMQWNEEAYGEPDTAFGQSSHPGVAFVLSTRDRRFIPPGATVREILKTDTGHQQAIRKYVDQKRDQPAVRSFVTHSEVTLEDITAASEYNFMYLWFVFKDIEEGRHSHLTAHEIPAGLIGYYEWHWRTLWEDESMMSPESMKVLLALAFSGVSYGGHKFPEAAFFFDQLQYVAGIEEPKRLRDLLKCWAQFLEERPVKAKTAYGFYHSSYLEFLLGQLEESRETDLIAKAMEYLHIDPETMFREIARSLVLWGMAHMGRPSHD